MNKFSVNEYVYYGNKVAQISSVYKNETYEIINTKFSFFADYGFMVVKESALNKIPIEDLEKLLNE